MPDPPLLIKRYPNRRFYSSHAKAYVTLEDIERLIREGHTVEIRDSQSGADLTRLVLTELLIERHPEKVALFPADLLHFMLRANDLMTDFLRNYFRDSLTYLEYLQTQGTAAPLNQSLHWMRSWLDNLTQSAHGIRTVPTAVGPTGVGPTDTGPTDTGPTDTGPTDTGPTDTGPSDGRPNPADPDPTLAGTERGDTQAGDMQAGDSSSETAQQRAEQLARQVAELEARIRRLEADR